MKKWALIVGIPAAAVGTITFLTLVGFERPYATPKEIDVVASSVSALKQKHIKLDARQLQWHVESLERQLGSAEDSCAKNNNKACSRAKKLAEQVKTGRDLLIKVRGW